MARWKARVDLLLSVIELLLPLRRYKAKRVKVDLAAFRRRWVTLSQDFRGRRRPWGIFLVYTKLDTFCYRLPTMGPTIGSVTVVPSQSLCDLGVYTSTPN